MVATEPQVAQNIGFGIIATIMIFGGRQRGPQQQRCACRAVAGVVLAGAAAQYLLLAAEFVAVTQVLVYIGAVMVLFLFGVMLTRARSAGDGPQQQGLGRSASPSRW